MRTHFRRHPNHVHHSDSCYCFKAVSRCEHLGTAAWRPLAWAAATPSARPSVRAHGLQSRSRLDSAQHRISRCTASRRRCRPRRSARARGRRARHAARQAARWAARCAPRSGLGDPRGSAQPGGEVGDPRARSMRVTASSARRSVGAYERHGQGTPWPRNAPWSRPPRRSRPPATATRRCPGTCDCACVRSCAWRDDHSLCVSRELERRHR